MKKLLLLFCALLCLGGSRAWATTYTVNVNSSEGTMSDKSGEWYALWTSNGTSELSGVKLQITTPSGPDNRFDMQFSDGKLNIHSSKLSSAIYTMKAPEGYVITGYSITATASTSNKTFTLPAIGYYTFYTGTAKTISETNLYHSEISFTLTDYSNKALVVESFSITLEDKGKTLSSISQLSNSKCYYIHNVRQYNQRGDFCISDDNTQVLTNLHTSASTNAGTASKKKFAIIAHLDKYYLYSVSESKFVTRTNSLQTDPGDYLTLTPMTEDASMTYLSWSGSTEYWICISSKAVNNLSTATLKINDSGKDAGAYFSFTEADDFDPTAALAAIDAVTDWEAVAIAYKETIQPDFEKAGLVGYPTTSSPTYTTLTSRISDITTLGDSYEKSNYEALVAAYEAYVATEDTYISKPSSGKFYRLKDYQNNTVYATGTDAVLKVSASVSDPASSVFYTETGSSLDILSYKYGNYIFNKSGTGAIVHGTPGTKTSYSFAHFSDHPFGTLRVYNGSSYWNSASTNIGFTTAYKDNPNTAFYFEEVTTLPITFYGEYASLYSPVDLILPSGVKAYTGTLNGDNSKLLLTVKEYVPANTGVILEFADFSAETTKDFSIRSSVTPVLETSLTGHTAATTVDDDATMVLGKDNEGNWGIYKYRSGTGTVILGGFKAYMNTPAISVKGFTFSFDDETGVNDVRGKMQNERTEIFNLAGQRMSRVQKGVNIVNGQKVLVK